MSEGFFWDGSAADIKPLERIGLWLFGLIKGCHSLWRMWGRKGSGFYFHWRHLERRRVTLRLAGLVMWCCGDSFIGGGGKKKKIIPRLKTWLVGWLEMQIWDGFGIFLLVPRRRSGECPSDFSSGWVCPWDWRPHPLTRPASSWLCQQLCLMVNTGSKPSTLTFHQGKTLIKPTFSKQSPHRRWRVKTAEAASAFATPRLLGFNNPTFVGYARYFTSTVGKVVRLTKNGLYSLELCCWNIYYLIGNLPTQSLSETQDTPWTSQDTHHSLPPSLPPPHTHQDTHPGVILSL